MNDISNLFETCEKQPTDKWYSKLQNNQIDLQLTREKNKYKKIMEQYCTCLHPGISNIILSFLFGKIIKKTYLTYIFPSYYIRCVSDSKGNEFLRAYIQENKIKYSIRFKTTSRWFDEPEHSNESFSITKYSKDKNKSFVYFKDKFLFQNSYYKFNKNIRNYYDPNINKMITCINGELENVPMNMNTFHNIKDKDTKIKCYKGKVFVVKKSDDMLIRKYIKNNWTCVSEKYFVKGTLKYEKWFHPDSVELEIYNRDNSGFYFEINQKGDITLADQF